MQQRAAGHLVNKAWSGLARSALKIVANVVVVLAFGLLAYSCYLRYRATGSFNWLGLLAVNALFVCMYAVRRDAKEISTSPSAWMLAFAACMTPLVIRPTDPGSLSIIGNAVQAVGIMLIVAGLLSLRRSFGIVPANRGIRQGGLYRLIRHPLYFSELLSVVGFVIANPSARNALLWMALVVLQLLRARAEERLLSADPEYREYAARVRHRLIPGLL